MKKNGNLIELGLIGIVLIALLLAPLSIWYGHCHYYDVRVLSYHASWCGSSGCSQIVRYKRKEPLWPFGNGREETNE